MSIRLPDTQSLLQDEITKSLKVQIVLQGLSVTKVAQKLKLSRNYVSQAINHPLHKPHQAIVLRVARLLNVTIPASL